MALASCMILLLINVILHQLPLYFSIDGSLINNRIRSYWFECNYRTQDLRIAHVVVLILQKKNIVMRIVRYLYPF